MLRSYALIFVIAILSGCANRYVLNEKVIKDNALSKEFLSHVQFYNTQDIVLTRYEESSRQSEAVKGTVNLNFGQQIDQIIIKAQTPGKIVQYLDGGKIAVSFEPDETKFLVFGPEKSTDVFRLQAKAWKSERGAIDYGGKTYYTNQGISKCALEFKLKKNYEQKRNTQVAKGNRIE